MEQGGQFAEGQNREKEGKRKRKISDSFIVIFLLAYLFIVVGQTLGSVFYVVPFLLRSEVGVTLALYLSFAGVWAVTLFYMSRTEKNRPILQVLWKKPAGNRLKKLLFGIGIGFALNGLCILIAYLRGDIMLYYGAFRPVYLLLFFIAMFIQSAAEEIVCRGFVYQRLLKSYGKPWAAVLGNSMLFGILHIFNRGVTVLSILNILLCGVLFSLIVYYLDSLWCAMAAHAAWNFTQNIIFGLPNSGIVSSYSLFRLDASTARDSFCYNVGFGIEGTLAVNLVLTAACVCVFLWGRKYGEKPFQVWEEE